MDERFIRLEQLVGKAGLERLQKSRVAIFGLGAVGSYALEALVRAGVGELVLVDFDIVRLSNFNRQLLALEDNLDKSKVESASKRALAVNPHVKVIAHREFAAKENFAALLQEKPDVVVDAIDSLNPKAQLIRYCLENNINIISSMGAGMRFDPFSIKAGPLNEVKGCPLAKALRKKLKREKVPVDFLCIYSTELPARNKIAVERQEDVYKRGRPRAPVG